jgi:DNA-binding response OmpR family regulator
MSKRVIDVGNCVPDHAAIRRLIETSFDAHVVQAHDLKDTLRELEREPAALVLVNRKLDIDYSDGMAIIRHLKSSDHLSSTPVMLISNYPEYQQEAVAAGCEPGFGKQELRSEETLAKFKRLLG